MNKYTSKKITMGYTRQLLYTFVVGCILAGCQSPSGQQEFDLKNYNVVFMVLDDQNAYGMESKDILTPTYDRLKESSFYFPNANCPAPLCIPSRASFFTGIAPHKSGAYMNGGDIWNKSQTLLDAETMAELFKRSGYYSYGRGKIYHLRLSEGRIEKNFDNRPIYEGGFGPFPDQEHRVKSTKNQHLKFWGVQSFKEDTFPDNINTEAVMDFLSQKQEKPFFLTLGLYRPHTPFTAPQRFFDLYDSAEIEIPEAYKVDDLDDVPAYGQSLLDAFGRFEVTGANNPDRWKRFIHAYYACNSFADWNVGRVLDALESSPNAENTIFILTTDNGFHVGSKNHWEKNTMWDASVITPLFIKIPGMKATRVEAPVGLIDLYPTLVELCGLEKPVQQLDGASLMPYLKNPAKESDEPVLTSFGENFVAFRSDKYRFIHYPDGEEELYNIKEDPFEWTNLARQDGYEDILENFRNRMPEEFAKELPGHRN